MNEGAEYIWILQEEGNAGLWEEDPEEQDKVGLHLTNFRGQGEQEQQIVDHSQGVWINGGLVAPEDRMQQNMKHFTRFFILVFAQNPTHPYYQTGTFL